MAHRPSVALSRRPCVALMALILAACAVEAPTPQRLAEAAQASEAAVTAAETARRTAIVHAAHGRWRAAANSVDAAMWALRDARRAESNLAASRLPAGHRQFARAPDGVPQAGGYDRTDALAERLERTLATAKRNRAKIEGIVTELRTLDRTAVARSGGAPAGAADPLPYDPDADFSPDTGYQQDVFGAQR